ncbi:MAG: sugar-binding domain-containing protein [Firmicutes bacterium]|nr:sugar-binding domain-containing protein [Bacillota bacterium]MDD4335783.1 sugar-binding domain-containing protein [Bacillota bacterium]MDD4791733.1 sugar-binding domain-containing protein [Bacillota bacterium]
MEHAGHITSSRTKMLNAAEIASLHRRVMPEFCERIILRYNILRHVSYAQPIGRRALAQSLGESERHVRREENILRAAGLVIVGSDGIRLSKDGEDILWGLAEYVGLLVGTGRLEELLQQEFGLRQAIVIAGDSDEDEAVKREMARVGACVLRDTISDGDVVAVCGGTTMAELAAHTVPAPGKRNVVVVPARGSLGEDVEKQADTVAALLAKKLGGAYRILNLPDYLGRELAASVAEEPRIKEVLHTIKRSRIVVHGVGTAVEMARRRNISPSEIEEIVGLGAVGEAFGFYFDRDGKVVYTTSSLGLRLTDLSAVNTVMCVGGGSSKGHALAAVLYNGFPHIVVTDEGAARAALDAAGDSK